MVGFDLNSKTPARSPSEPSSFQVRSLMPRIVTVRSLQLPSLLSSIILIAVMHHDTYHVLERYAHILCNSWTRQVCHHLNTPLCEVRLGWTLHLCHLFLSLPHGCDVRFDLNSKTPALTSSDHPVFSLFNDAEDYDNEYHSLTPKFASIDDFNGSNVTTTLTMCLRGMRTFYVVVVPGRFVAISIPQRLKLGWDRPCMCVICSSVCHMGQGCNDRYNML